MVEAPHFGDYFKNTLHGLSDNILGRTLWELSKVFHVEQRGQEYIPKLQEHLQNGALIVPFTHPSVVDPMLVIHLMMEYFDLETQRFLMLTGKKFLDGRMGPHAVPLINFMQNRYGIEFVPIVQSNDDFYTELARAEFNGKQLKYLRETMTCEPKGLLIGLAPQGTRSPEMLRGQKGFDFLIRSNPESCMIAPLALHGTENIHRKGDNLQLNFGAQVTAQFLAPIKATELIELAKSDRSRQLRLTMADQVMYRFAQVIPPENRGVYSVYPPLPATPQEMLKMTTQ